MKIFYKNCPGCGVTQSYSGKQNNVTKWRWKTALKNNILCRSCVKVGSVPWNKGKPHSEKTLKKISEALKGRTFSEEWTDKISKSHRKRLSKNVRGQNRCPRYNLSACNIFDEINTTLGLNGRHGTSGGEYFVSGLGYWLDFYDKESNIVIEYHEKHHRRKKIQRKDERREREVKRILNCRYFVIREEQDWRDIINANIL